MARSKNEPIARNDFNDVLSIIDNAKNNAFRAVNKELINMYWLIGEFVSNKVKNGIWGSSIVDELSETIQRHNPGVSGFSSQNLRRMRQFYETYRNDPICSPLVSEIGWTQNIAIMARETREERQFYLQITAYNRYTKRELERQIDSGLYERTMLSKNYNAKGLLTDEYGGLADLRDSYVLEFLDLPEGHREKDLRRAIVSNLKDFILEFGKDFAFVGEEYRVQVGNEDFFIDLVFYNRKLSCLVAIELKTEKFKPAHMGQMQFYLEALDRDVRKENENLSVGLLLCASKDDAVVEYTMSKSLAPSIIASYSKVLPDKKILEKRVKELVMLAKETCEVD
jgi:predicted nuclease of restriction endonuclease-like (RecB) superfamily